MLSANESKKLLFAISIGLLFVLFSSPAICQDSKKNAPKSKMLKGQVDVFGVLTEDLQADLGLTCTKDNAGVMKVAKVRLGTEAYYKGLQEGDKLLNATADKNEVAVTFNRDGHVYTAKLMHYGAGQTLASGTPTPDNSKTPILQAHHNMLASDAQATETNRVYKLNTKKAQLLASYSLEMIVDQSLSMRSPDCPGNLSRWGWVGEQASAIATAISPYITAGVTFIPFNADFTVYEHVTAPQLVTLFANPNFRSGTRLAEPLSARLNSFVSTYKSGTKPLLLTIITDGLPFPKEEPPMVKQVLIDITQKMIDPHEITVVFLQVGGRDEKGKHYLEDLDANLVSYGAKYPIVQTKSFDQLKEIGLGEALVDAIQDYNAQNGIANQTKSSPAAKKAATKQPAAHKSGQ